MPNEINLQGNNDIIIQDATSSVLKVCVNGQVQEILNELSALKSLLGNSKGQKIHVAEKIYNIEHINEANFGYLTGKVAFNETLTKQIISAIRHFNSDAERIAQNPNWDKQKRNLFKVQNFLSQKLVGVIGIQLRKLFAIGQEDDNTSRSERYVEKCCFIAQRSLDLVCFALLSKFWDGQKCQEVELTQPQKELLSCRFDDSLAWSINDQFKLLKVLVEIFSSNTQSLSFPIPELEKFTEILVDGSELHISCQELQKIHDKPDKTQYDLLSCFEAESHLAQFFKYFHFLANYKMASIKHINYCQVRNASPNYLHSYTALGLDSNDQQDCEEVNYTIDTVDTDAVLLYRGDNYKDNINLYPFVFDYNSLILETGSKICFFHSKEISEDNLEYLFLEDNSIIKLEHEEIIQSESMINKIMKDKDSRGKVNVNNVIIQFNEARNCIIGYRSNLDDL